MYYVSDWLSQSRIRTYRHTVQGCAWMHSVARLVAARKRVNRESYSLSLASVKSRLVLPFWYRLTCVVPEKWPLNGCVCVCVCFKAYWDIWKNMFWLNQWSMDSVHFTLFDSAIIWVAVHGTERTAGICRLRFSEYCREQCAKACLRQMSDGSGLEW